MEIEAKDMYKVKKFRIEDNYNFEHDIIGILVENNGKDSFFSNPLYAYNYKIIGIDGSEKQVRGKDILEISIVKNIDKNVREMMNQYGVKRKNMDKEISKAKAELIYLYTNNEKEEKKLLENIMVERKLLFPEEFERKIYGEIRKIVDSKYHLFVTGSHLDNSINIGISMDIEKYAKPENYSFIYKEYDRTLHIDSDMLSYKELKEKYDKNFKILSLKEIKDIKKKYNCEIIEQESNFSIGDKDWLSYNFYLYIRFDDNFILNEEYANKVISVVSKFV